MIEERRVLPEILDSLPSTNPEAIRSRKDLHRLNVAMGNYRWIASGLNESVRSNLRDWVEPGAGDGPLSRALNDSVIQAIKVDAVDFLPRPDHWPENWNWSQGDLFEILGNFSKQGAKTGLISNLFLHHFEGEDLRKIGVLIQDSYSQLLICEPARFSRFQWLARLVFPLVNRITRHDMIISIEAGFRINELPKLLHLDPEVWEWRESVSLMGAYRLKASKRE